jgi:hypothetical protein
MREELHKAGTTYDGHVTNGSIESQMKVLKEFLLKIKSELKVAADFGEFENKGKYPEYVAIEILKRVANKRGIEL